MNGDEIAKASLVKNSEALAAYNSDGGDEKKLNLQPLHHLINKKCYTTTEELILHLYGVYPYTYDSKPTRFRFESDRHQYFTTIRLLPALPRMLGALEFYEKHYHTEGPDYEMRFMWFHHILCNYDHFWTLFKQVYQPMMDRLIPRIDVDFHYDPKALIIDKLRYVVINVFIKLIIICQRHAPSAIYLLKKFQPYFGYLEELVNTLECYPCSMITEYLCEVFPNTYALAPRDNWTKVSYKSRFMYDYGVEKGIIHRLAHPRRRKDLLETIMQPMPNNRYHPMLNCSVEELNLCKSAHELDICIVFIRTGLLAAVYKHQHVLMASSKPSLEADIRGHIIRSLWFHLAKPTFYFTTLELQYYYPNFEKTKMVEIKDQVHTDLIDFHQRVIDHIHFLDVCLNIIPAFIVEIIKNIYLSDIHIATHDTDSKYLHSLVRQECKATNVRTSKIEGVTVEATKLRKRKRN